METHTPGEWSCDYGDFCVFSDRGGEIAKITAGRNEDGSTIGAREMEANMQLIAAAPELLMACRMLVALEDGDVHDADTSWKQARKIMRAAIAKAEGRPE